MLIFFPSLIEDEVDERTQRIENEAVKFQETCMIRKDLDRNQERKVGKGVRT